MVEGQALWQEGDGEPAVKYDPRESLAPVIAEVGSAVVSIRSRRGDTVPAPPPSDGASGGAGSGFIISADGLVVTNHHVVDGAQAIEVKLSDGRTMAATVRGTDPETDLALCQIDKASGLPTVELGTSKDLRVGDWVIAVGSPMGLEQSATTGIVSAKGRGSLGLYRESYIDFLQTDAAISPGSSGGPLFDLDGEVVAINTAVGIGRGLGFAIPIEQAKRVIPQLQSVGKVTRGWLGVTGRDVTLAVGQVGQPGAVIEEVYGGTPADKAGLQRRDRVLEVNDQPIETFADLRGRVADLDPGSEIKLDVERDGQAVELSLVLEARPDSGQLARLRRIGAQGGKLYPDGDRRLGVYLRERGDRLQIERIEPGSLADELGLEARDVIEQINEVPIVDAEDVREALQRDDARLRVRVQRRGATHTATIERS